MTTIKKSAIKFLASAFGAALCTIMASSGSAYALSMKTTNFTTQPIGHNEFCKAAPVECQRTGRNIAPHQLTRASWAKIVDVNNHVNTTVAPLTDLEIWGKMEVWSYPTNVGDCEDYVLLKRIKLIKAGINPGNLLITVVKQPNGEGHAVLTVRTDRGDFILDNLVGRIDDWRDTPYEYLKRQSTEHAGRWVTIEDNRSRIARN
ncbi:transglutaminase-like cysteine peptidase [Ahrensia sp. 13_GOM-1096m]|uniref:transglutaminase-like cysteine peptidase n=1 Tax=Ahrensia sp. 13_GOM-1096m TaxID=1380380 RepID=UPI00047C1816